MSDNPFSEAMDEAAAETTSADKGASELEFDLDGYFDALNTGPKEKTIGIAVNEEMHAFYHELQNADEVEIEVSQSIRDHIEKLAHRHEQVFERAMRKLEIEREY
jgi:hypothetical protein